MDQEFEAFVQRVKEANALEDVIEQTGAEFKLERKHGRTIKGEIHDSLVVNVDEQYFVWYSKNPVEKGDVFNWLEYRNKWDFWTSLQWLAERAKLNIPQHLFRSDDQPARMVIRSRETVFGVASRVMTKWLLEDQEVRDYCFKRGWDEKIIEEAGLGFSGRATTAYVKDMRGEMQMHEVDLDSPQAVAVMGYKGNVSAWGKKYKIDVFKEWVEWGMIPGIMGRTRLVYSHWLGGRCKYLSCRNILGAEINESGKVIKSYNPPKNLAGIRQPYFNYEYAKRAEECMIVEGQADAVTLAAWGIAAVALAGTGWQDHRLLLMDLVKRHKNLYLGMDADEAGMRALMGDGGWDLGLLLGPLTRVVKWAD